MNEKTENTIIIEAYKLERGDIFVWQNRMYVVDNHQSDDFTYLNVREIAAYDSYGNKWTGSAKNGLENFNGYARVRKVTMPAEWQFGI